MRFKKLAALLFGAAVAGSASTATATEKEVIQSERKARVEKIQSVTENSPLYFSEAQVNTGDYGLLDHYSHSSHSSHSSHFSHRSSF